jgi:drug/metabolite transporter (DMT)-like permease
MQKPSKHFIGASALLLVTLLWGATFVIVKESLNSASPMIFIASRFTIASVLFLPFVIYKKVKFNSAAVKTGIILGVLLFMGFATQTVGLKYTTATKSGFITGSAVVMIPILQTIIHRKPPTKASIIGVVLVTIGILFLSSGGNSIFTFLSELGGSFNFGDFLTFLCAFFFAAYIIYLESNSAEHDFMNLLSVQLIVTALLGFSAALIFSSTGIEEARIEFTPYLIFGLIYTSVFATLITTALHTKYQKDVSPTKTGIIFSLEPIFAAVFAYFLLNEIITNFGFIGSVLIIAGLLISEVSDSFKRKHV